MKRMLLLAVSIASLSYSIAQSGAAGQIIASSVQVNSGGTTRPCLVWLPASYNDPAESSCNYPLLVFNHGLGECGPANGSEVDKLKVFGPFTFLQDGQWSGNAVHNSNTYKFIVFAIQATCPWPLDAAEVDYAITKLRDQFRIDGSKIVATGPSLGGDITVNLALRCGSIWANPIRHMIPMSVSAYNGGTSCSGFNTAIANGMKVWAFAPDSPTDPASSTYYNFTNQLVQDFNAAAPGSAKFTHNTPQVTRNTHCCWNDFYIPTFTESDNDGSGDVLNIYQWAAKKLYDGEPMCTQGSKESAGYVSGTGQSNKTNACAQTSLETEIFTDNGTLAVGTTVYSSSTGGSFNGNNLYWGFNTGPSGGNAVQSVLIDQNGQVTTIENCISTFAGYLTLPGTDIASACNNTETSRVAVYTSDGKIGYQKIIYTDEDLTQVFNGSWASYGFALTTTGPRIRSLSIDNTGLSFRYVKCPFVLNRILAGYITAGATTSTAACNQSATTAVYTDDGNVDEDAILYLSQSNYNDIVAGEGKYYGFSSNSGGSIAQTLLISNANVTDVVSCGSGTFAGYLTLPGTDIASACNNTETSRVAVYTSDGKIGYQKIIYTDEDLTQVFNGSWASYGFALTTTGPRIRSLSIDNTGLSFRYVKCPFVLNRILAGYITAGATTSTAACNQSATTAVYTDDGNVDEDAILYLSQSNYNDIVAGDGKYYGYSTTLGGPVTQTLLISNANVTAVADCDPGGQARNNVISEADKASLRIYPNPARTFVMIEGLRQLPTGTVGEIIDANGRTIQKIRLNTDRQRIDTKTWNKGIYLVRILDNKGGLLLTKKLIIQ